MIPKSLAGWAIAAGVAIAGMITGLAAAHDQVPQTLDFLATALVAGGVGIAVPTPASGSITPASTPAPPAPPIA